MKFGRTIAETSFPAWADQYFDYKSGKKFIKRVVAAAQAYRAARRAAASGESDDSTTDSSTHTAAVEAARVHRATEQQNFRKFILGELGKINDFVQLKEDECKAHFERHLMSQAHMLLNSRTSQANAADVFVAFYDFVEELRQLLQYGQLNYTAFVKILKKYDKNTKSVLKAEFMPLVAGQHFYTSNFFPQLLQDSQIMLDQLLVQYPLLNASTARSMYASTHPVQLFLQRPSELVFRAFAYVKRISLNKILLWTVFLVLLESLLIQVAGVQIQATGCTITQYLHDTQRSKLVDDFTDMIHNRITSKFWLLLCAVVLWLYDSRHGSSAVAFVAIGFAIKSLAKNIIRSPRGFWLCTSYQAFYCGKGYSLPSGHSMVSLTALGFLLLKFKRPWLLLVTILYQMLIFWCVQYIGTHTIADLVVGWTCAILCLVVYAKGEEQVYRRYTRFRLQPSSRSIALIVIGATLLTLALDTLVELWPPAFEADWQSNMETVCGLRPGSGASRMYLNLNWSNTPLVFGCLVAWLANRRYLSGALERFSFFQRVPLALGGAYVFVLLPAFLKTCLYGLVGIASRHAAKSEAIAAISQLDVTTVFYHLFNLLMPVWVIFLAPLLFVMCMRAANIKGTGAASKLRPIRRTLTPSMVRLSAAAMASAAGGVSPQLKRQASSSVPSTPVPRTLASPPSLARQPSVVSTTKATS
ncbi:hypothetical protein CAOG_01083 [Capsaspora owczarzaki ATCC 30864]|uniref:SPX domain-containing protein n=1 Tax=Capsaspora owczarzaki (strain ATCC 30864) TaxID=595528 RepID=A0A0D2U398_CAPO3|nr:hypothetical protein CAOG_01083 [Capsaspora owczarzaki ATCC 30864]KJE89646.1 hypothetical protein CAOG_001083 [Capsaspora owczarzaki ATCC 30864]|eukprot:XP_004365954.1 hypothetical protein CAOG_01083 [Capsaspora owczarzaki ATCC 30864]